MQQDSPASSPDPAGAWYIIRTAPSFMTTLAAQCRQLGVRLYVPKYARRVAPRRRRRERVVERPVFPGYAFVPAGEAEALRYLPHHRYQFLRSGSEQFVTVGAETIEHVAQVEAELCQYEVDPEPIDHFKVGDKVRIVGDVWAPMQVQGFVGSTVKLECAGMEIRVDAALLRKVEE